jgi:hypothetical protein
VLLVVEQLLLQQEVVLVKDQVNKVLQVDLVVDREKVEDLREELEMLEVIHPQKVILEEMLQETKVEVVEAELVVLEQQHQMLLMVDQVVLDQVVGQATVLQEQVVAVELVLEDLVELEDQVVVVEVVNTIMN